MVLNYDCMASDGLEQSVRLLVMSTKTFVQSHHQSVHSRLSFSPPLRAAAHNEDRAEQPRHASHSRTLGSRFETAVEAAAVEPGHHGSIAVFADLIETACRGL